MLSAKRFKGNGLVVRKTTVMKCIVERLQALNVYVQTHHTALSGSCPVTANERTLLPRFYPAKNDFSGAKWLCPAATADESLYAWELAVAAVKGDFSSSDLKGELEAILPGQSGFLTRWGDWADADKVLYTLGRIVEMAAVNGTVTVNGDLIAVALRKAGPVLHLSNTRVWLPPDVKHIQLPVRRGSPHDPFHWEATAVPSDICGTGTASYLHKLTRGDDAVMSAWHGLCQAYRVNAQALQPQWWDYVKSHPPTPREFERYSTTHSEQGVGVTCGVRKSLTSDDQKFAEIDVRRMFDIVVNTMKVCSAAKFYRALGRPAQCGVLSADLNQRKAIAAAIGLPYHDLPDSVYRGTEYKMPANRWVLTHERPTYGLDNC